MQLIDKELADIAAVQLAGIQFNMTLANQENEMLRKAVRDLSDYGAVDLVPNMAIVSLVGTQLKKMVGISGRFFSVLGQNNINIEMISQGE